MHKQFVTAQQAMELPEVQEMARRLSAYGLGVSMPHMHDDTGDLVPMPEGTVQVEGDDLRAFFVPADQVADTPEQRYVTVGWRWSEKTNSMSGTVHCPLKKEGGVWTHQGARKTN